MGITPEQHIAALTMPFDAQRVERVDIMRANRLATTAERAHAWDTLMAHRSDGPNPDADAVEHAAENLCDMVTYRLRQEQPPTCARKCDECERLLIGGTGHADTCSWRKQLGR